MLNVRTGAATLTRTAKSDPQVLLYSLMEDDPNSKKEILFSRWVKKIHSDDGLLDAVLKHAFTNMFQNCEYSRKSAERRIIPAAVLQQEQEKKVQSFEALKEIAKAKIREAVILDTIMPNGKSLRECKGSYAVKVGGWIGRIGASVGPNEIIGEVLSDAEAKKLSEAQVRKLFR